MGDLERAITSALKSGGKVRIVGEISPIHRGRLPTVLAPVPDPMVSWSNYAYVTVVAVDGSRY